MLGVLVAVAAACGVRPNTLRAPAPPTGEATPTPGREPTNRGPSPASAPLTGADAGL